MEDIGLALADFVSNMENVPSEISHLFSEITDLDEKFEEAMSHAQQCERSLHRELKEKANREQAGARELELLTQIDKDHESAKSYCQEKSRLTQKALTIVQRHLSKLDAEIRHYDKTPFDQPIGRRNAGYGAGPATPTALGTIGIQNGELDGFRLHTPKRFSDSIVSLGLDGSVAGETDSFYTPSRVPKRRHQQQGQQQQQQQQQPNGSAGAGSRPVQRHKKQLKLANSILSLDGVEVDSNGAAGGGIEESDDQLYCFCQQVSYGDMVACDGSDCRYEWFHWECVGLTSPPKGSWYCSDCLAKLIEDDAD